jgi:hypothetical protein
MKNEITPAVPARSARGVVETIAFLVSCVKSGETLTAEDEREIQNTLAAHTSQAQACRIDCEVVHNIECPNRRTAPPSGSSPSAEHQIVCDAVSMMNQGEHYKAHQLLRKWLVDYAATAEPRKGEPR